MSNLDADPGMPLVGTSSAIEEVPSAGLMLRRAREAEGLHIAALSVALKVPVKKLEALEADRFDLLSDMVFARALAASCCRVLKVDPAPILARFPLADSPRLKTDETGINAPFRGAQSSGGLHRIMAQAKKPLGVAIILMIIATIALMMLPRELSTGRSPSDAPVSSDSALSKPAASSHGDAPAPAKPASGQLSDAPPSAAPVPPIATPVDAPLLQLTAKGSSWVEVTDATGFVHLRRVVVTAEKVPVAGVPPFSVVLGKAENVEVMVRGKVVDVTASTRDNVARFEVK